MTRILLTFLLLLAAISATPTLAENKKPSPEREQIRRLQQAQQRAEQEKASLQFEKTTLEEQLQRAEDDLHKSASRAGTLSRQVRALELEKAALSARLTESEKLLAELGEAHKKAQVENSRLQSLLARKNSELTVSEAKNTQLYKYSLELMERIQNRGVFSSFAQIEPFTGLKRVEIENLLDEYHDKVDAQKVEPAAPR